jgi:hypothetical protein
MPKLEEFPYDGFSEKIARLGLTSLLNELRHILGEFDLRVREEKNANGGARVRELIDERFSAAESWTKIQSGGIDWTKCHTAAGTSVCVGVEVQMSARSDMLVMDVQHLRVAMIEGRIDVGVLAVPSDILGRFLTDRGPTFSDAKRHVELARATDLPLLIVGLTHDGPGDPLPKKRTRSGRDDTV